MSCMVGMLVLEPSLPIQPPLALGPPPSLCPIIQVIFCPVSSAVPSVRHSRREVSSLSIRLISTWTAGQRRGMLPLPSFLFLSLEICRRRKSSFPMRWSSMVTMVKLYISRVYFHVFTDCRILVHRFSLFPGVLSHFTI